MYCQMVCCMWVVCIDFSNPKLVLVEVEGHKISNPEIRKIKNLVVFMLTYLAILSLIFG